MKIHIFKKPLSILKHIYTSLIPDIFSSVIEICISNPSLLIKNNEHFLFY